MSQKVYPLTLAAVLVIAFAANGLSQTHSGDDHGAGDHGAGKGQDQAGGMDAAMMAAMQDAMKLTQPSEHHAKLEALVGEWNVSMKMFMGPGMPPSESKGKSSNKWVLGKRFVMQEFSGSFNMPGMGDVAYEGIGMIGFDNYKNMYVGMWTDSMNTHMLTYRGAPNPTINGIVSYGEMDEPMIKVQDRMVRYDVMFKDKNSYVMTIYDLAVAPDYKVVELTYTRK